MFCYPEQLTEYQDDMEERNYPTRKYFFNTLFNSSKVSLYKMTILDITRCFLKKKSTFKSKYHLDKT